MKTLITTILTRGIPLGIFMDGFEDGSSSAWAIVSP